MEEILKELIPVMQEAIRAGKTVGLGYIVVLYIVPVLKLLVNWIFGLVVLKGVYSLILNSFEKE